MNGDLFGVRRSMILNRTLIFYRTATLCDSYSEFWWTFISIYLNLFPPHLQATHSLHSSCVHRHSACIVIVLQLQSPSAHTTSSETGMESNPKPEAAAETTSTQEQPWKPMWLRRRPNTTTSSGSPPEDSPLTSTEDEAGAHDPTAAGGDAGTDPRDGYTESDLVETVAHHFVFVIDRSGSMGIDDVTPRIGSRFAVSRRHNNRLGCTYDAILNFVRTRLSMSQEADLVSAVLFDDTAEVAVEGRPIRESIVDDLMDYAPGLGTCYSQGLQVARSVIQRVARRDDGAAREKRPFIVFLGDGGNSYRDGDPLTIIESMVSQDDPRLVVNTIQFGTKLSTNQVDLLREMAAAGSGTRTVGRGGPGLFVDWRDARDTNTTRGDGSGGSSGGGSGGSRWSQGRSSGPGVYQMSELNEADLCDSFGVLARNLSSGGENRLSGSESTSPGEPEPRTSV